MKVSSDGVKMNVCNADSRLMKRRSPGEQQSLDKFTPGSRRKLKLKLDRFKRAYLEYIDGRREKPEAIEFGISESVAAAAEEALRRVKSEEWDTYSVGKYSVFSQGHEGARLANDDG